MDGIDFASDGFFFTGKIKERIDGLITNLETFITKNIAYRNKLDNHRVVSADNFERLTSST